MRTVVDTAQLLSLGIALLIGLGFSVQTAMLGLVARQRGSTGAAWMSILATIVGPALLFGVRALRGAPPLLPAPLDRAWIFGVIAVGAGVALLLTMRNLDAYYAAAGVFGLTMIVGMGALAPRLGVALFLSALVAGQLIGGMTMDQLGAFGGAVHRVSVLRVAGVGALLLGVALVRGGGD
ncbi:MAG: DMT family transporter [Dehalococcoidia bacterium]